MKPQSRRQFLHTTTQLGAGIAAASTIPFADSIAAPPKLPPSPNITGEASLGAHAAAHGLLYGCAVDVHALAADPAYATLIREQCRILVAENAMKWPALRPSPSTFRFDDADALVAFAETNRMKIRGHNLLWHRDNPKWLDTTATSTTARQLLTTHIETVAGRYAGRMHSWDVVNEAIEVADGRADDLRNSSWLRLAGDDYIELAFRTARNADPQALLTYNDYGIEAETHQDERKRQSMLALLRRMVARHVPLDAVGIQSHISALATPASADGSPVNGPAYGPSLVRFIAAIRELGLQVFLTEMDVNDRASPANLPFRDAAVSAACKQYLDQALSDPAVSAVLTWGITDRYTWLNHEGSRPDHQPERCLPFDSANQPTASFFAMRDAFDRRTSKQA